MRGVLYGLVAVACIIVIAAGGIWLWDRYDAARFVAQQADATAKAATAKAVANSKCNDAILTLRAEASNPSSVTSAEKQAATDVYIECRAGL